MFQNKSLPFRLLLLSLLWALPLSAQQKQTFTVEFEPDPLDATAQNTKHQKRDGDGQRYAIIKVRSTSPDDDLKAYDFNFGYLKHEVKQHNESELWVYVQRNAKWVTISRQGYATMEKFDLRTTIEAGHTYRMLLSPTAAPVLTQMVMFSITPADAHAAVSVRSEKEGAEEDYWGSVDETGRIARPLPLGTYTYKVMSQDFLPSEGRLQLNQANQTHEERVQLRPNFADITLRAADPNTEIYVNGQQRGRGSWSGRMKTGVYQVETRLTNHKPASLPLTVTLQEARTVDLPAPIPITGTLAVTSKPLGARIFLDGKDLQKTTPVQMADIPIGQHEVKLLFDDNRSYTESVSVKENETTSVEGLHSGLKKEGSSENARQRREAGQKRSSQPKVQSQSVFAATGGYVAPFLQVGQLTGVGGGVGGYLHHFNVEASYMMGLAKSEEILWHNPSTGSEYSGSYQPAAMGFRLGYGIFCGRTLRLTPQLGANIVSIKMEGGQSKGYATAATIGLRAELALGAHFSLFAAPELSLAVKESDIFQQVADVSTKVKAWGGGFNARVGVSVNF